MCGLTVGLLAVVFEKRFQVDKSSCYCRFSISSKTIGPVKQIIAWIKLALAQNCEILNVYVFKQANYQIVFLNTGT